MTYESEILAAAYDADIAAEFNRLISTPARQLEFSTVCHTLESYAGQGSVVLDIGCGPGRYAEYLLSKGYYVGCIDLSARSLKAFSERIQGRHDYHLLFNRVSCATQLHWVDHRMADAILLLGPLYHLTRNACRNQTLEHCQRILKPGGILLAMYLDAGADHPQLVTSTTYNGFVVPQYRCQPQNAADEASPWFSLLDTLPLNDDTHQFLQVFQSRFS
jgi:SAM-dependent methyltransferase